MNLPRCLIGILALASIHPAPATEAVEVSPTTGAAVPYTEGGETTTPATPRTGAPAVAVAGNQLPVELPERPELGQPGVSEYEIV
jgi:hypothetical protein